VIGGPNLPDDQRLPPEPIDYESAVRNILRKRRQRKIPTFLRRLDPRPTSPGQVLLVGLVLAVAGSFIPALHLVLFIGLALLVIGFLSGLVQPQGRTVTWRNRNIELPPRKRWSHRLYWILYRHSGPPA